MLTSVYGEVTLERIVGYRVRVPIPNHEPTWNLQGAIKLISLVLNLDLARIDFRVEGLTGSYNYQEPQFFLAKDEESVTMPFMG